MKKNVIIVAGGNGNRMQTTLPKQFLLLQGKPILMHSIQRFYDFDPSIKIILALPSEHISLWNDLVEKYHFPVVHDIVNGGEFRFHSVKNALSKVDADALVAIHDGVRPLVSKQTIQNCFLSAERFGSAIPVIMPVDSIRKISGDKSESVDRSEYRLVQTPQVFQYSIIKIAYEQSFDALFTDDASVVEKNGHFVQLVDGNFENIKITTPSDLLIASAFLNS